MSTISCNVTAVPGLELVHALATPSRRAELKHARPVIHDRHTGRHKHRLGHAPCQARQRARVGAVEGGEAHPNVRPAVGVDDRRRVAGAPPVREEGRAGVRPLLVQVGRCGSEDREYFELI